MVGLAAAVLHDVELAARGPADAGEVVAEHPERRPESLSRGELDARLDAAGAAEILPPVVILADV